SIDEGFQNLTSSGPVLPTSCEYLSLTRSTFVGGQRFCSYLWSGDTDSTFDVLLQQVTAGVSVAASGISAWTLDIGGFAGLNVDTDEGKELRLGGFGSHTDLLFFKMRVHGTSTLPHANPCPNEPWSYGDDNFIVTKKDLQASGKSIMRPLYHDFSLSDPFVANATRFNEPAIVHQFMLGELGVTSKKVYLPV
ncbi:hypothetical protein MPER_04713, partial [Moniliophthora perniciosa FA553]